MSDPLIEAALLILSQDQEKIRNATGEVKRYIELFFSAGENRYDYLGGEMIAFITYIFESIIERSLGVLGIFGSITSIIVLKKSGLGKSSNILLFVLAIADLLYLIGLYNLPLWFYETDGVEGWQTSETVAHFLYGLALLINHFISFPGLRCSLFLPVFITSDRLVAIFLPFRYPDIVRPFRTWVAVAVLVAVLYVFPIYSLDVTYFRYVFSLELNRSVGIMKFSRSAEIHAMDNLYVQDAIDGVTGYLPIVLVLSGCAMIFVKVTVMHTKRKLIMATGSEIRNQRRQSRTTRTLLTVCLVYLVTNGFVCIMSVIQFRIYINDYVELLANIRNVGYTINSCSNFIIYIIMNKNFRAICMSLFMCPACCGKAKNKKELGERVIPKRRLKTDTND